MTLLLSHQIASEGLKHRVIEASLADLQGDEDHAYRKIRLRIEDVQGKNVLTNFWVCITLRLLFVFFLWVTLLTLNVPYWLVLFVGYGLHHRQVEITCQEKAITDWGSYWCEDNWCIYIKNVLHRLHQEAREPAEGHMLCKGQPSSPGTYKFVIYLYIICIGLCEVHSFIPPLAQRV